MKVEKSKKAWDVGLTTQVYRCGLHTLSTLAMRMSLSVINPVWRPQLATVSYCQ